MATTGERVRDWQGPAILSYGFRPFFLGGALWAAVSMALWIVLMAGAVVLPLRFDPVSWHAHEFLFGYLGAVIAGFLLTAVPNWTGRLPVVGWPLGALAALWLAGRVAVSTAALWPVGLVALVDLAFPAALAGFLAREILAGRNWRNLAVLALVLAFMTGNGLYHLNAMDGGFAVHSPGLRLGIGAAVLLVALVGGRIVPSFTRNWLVKRGSASRPAPPMQAFDRIALLALLVAAALWVFWPEAWATGAALLAAGLLHIVRLARWQGLRTLREPLVWILHLSYAFVPLGALALGAATLAGDGGLASASLHVWTIGAIGTMTLAVMTRATLGHTGGELHAGLGTMALYLAMPAALAFRLAAPVWPGGDLALMASGALWIAAYLGFALLYGPRLARARRDTV